MEQNGTDSQDNLTDKQLAILPYLIASPSVSESARLAGIGRSTLYRWMEDHEFREALERLRTEAAELAHTELKGLMLKGILVLAEAMEDDNPTIRLRAAQAALTTGLKAIDLKELQKRLERVDDAYRLWASRTSS